MIRAWRWVADYWWIPALVLVGVILAIFGRRLSVAVFGSGFSDRLGLELEVIRARREVRAVQAKSSREAAIRFLQVKYAARFEELTAQERARAAALESDPEALAKLMVQLTRRQDK